jgi:hypothetical protein
MAADRSHEGEQTVPSGTDKKGEQGHWIFSTVAQTVTEEMREWESLPIVRPCRSIDQ